MTLKPEVLWDFSDLFPGGQRSLSPSTLPTGGHSLTAGA